MPADSIKKTIVVALGVCFVCSVLVSTAAVTLKPRQEKNKRLEKIKNILIAGDLFKEGTDVEDIFKKSISSRVVQLETGAYLDEAGVPQEAQAEKDGLLSSENYDIKKIMGHSTFGEAIPGDKDLADIKRKPKFALIYMVKEGDAVQKIILPMFGKGLWSTMYGFMALDRDLKTIKGFTFYEHGETPGLGGEVDNPRWKALWKGKMAFGENDEIKIEVVKGQVDTSRPDAMYKVDGLSGSTLTTRGVHNLVRFWLGDEGYGPLLKKLREGGING